MAALSMPTSCWFDPRVASVPRDRIPEALERVAAIMRERPAGEVVAIFHEDEKWSYQIHIKGDTKVVDLGS